MFQSRTTHAVGSILVLGLLAGCGQKPAEEPFPASESPRPSPSAQPGGSSSPAPSEAPAASPGGAALVDKARAVIAGRRALLAFTITDQGLSPTVMEAPPGLKYTIQVKNLSSEEATLRVEGQKDVPALAAGASGEITLALGPGTFALRVPEQESDPTYKASLVIAPFKTTR